MARRKRNFSYRKLANAIEDNIIFTLNQLGNRLNKSIQDGINKGESIDGGKHKRLSPKTSQKKRGSSAIPLKNTGNMSRTKKLPATSGKLAFQLKMNAGRGKNKSNVQYGAYHQVGFTNSPQSAYPNTKVPARKWWGIPQTMQPGGKELNKWIEVFFAKIRSSVNK